MRNAKDTLDEQFLAMRAHCLMLAADFDRLERTPGGEMLLKTDPRIAALRQAVAIAADGSANRAPRVETLFSDK